MTSSLITIFAVGDGMSDRAAFRVALAVPATPLHQRGGATQRGSFFVMFSLRRGTKKLTTIILQAVRIVLQNLFLMENKRILQQQ